MLIWGVHVRRRFLGRVADYCSVCQDAQPMRIVELRSWPHLCFIPVWRSTYHGHVMRCERCRNVSPAVLSNYQTPIRDRKATLEQLCDRTNPDLPQRIAMRLDKVDRVRSGTGSPADRLDTMVDQTMGVAIAVQNRTGQLPWRSLLAVPLMFVTMFAGLLLTAVLPLGPPNVRGPVGVTAAIVAGIALPVGLIATDTRRFARRQIRRKLVPELSAANPSLGELTAYVDLMKASGMRIARYLDARRLDDQVRDHRGESRSA